MRDHPRIRGEHGWPAHHIKSTMGSSPHTRGAPADCREKAIECADHPRIRGEHRALNPGGVFSAGSSPHTRGAHRLLLSEGGELRIIPAYAGSTHVLDRRRN